MNIDVNATLARFPELRPLRIVENPPWRFTVLDSGVLTGTRVHDGFAEGLWVIDRSRAGVHRRPIRKSPDPAVSDVNFSGPLSDAVALLQQAPRAQHPS
jgi:hypothetical protein